MVKRGHKNIFQRCRVLIVLSLYLFITLSNIFMVANTTVYAYLQTHQYALKADIKNFPVKSTVTRADKAVVKENNKSLLRDTPILSFSYYSGRNIVPQAQLSQFSAFTPFKICRLTYLSLHNLRI